MSNTPPDLASTASAPGSTRPRIAYERAHGNLSRAFGLFGVPLRATVTDGGIVIPYTEIRSLNARFSSIDDGGRGSFVRALLRGRPGEDVLLRGDEGFHLARTIEEAHRQHTRAEQIRRGRIPGALSGAEAVALMRRHPGLVGRVGS